jgi:hypothetical protein
METLYIDMKINFVCSLWKIYYYFFDKVEDLILNIVVKFCARLGFKLFLTLILKPFIKNISKQTNIFFNSFA